jgi:hypothetical protein
MKNIFFTLIITLIAFTQTNAQGLRSVHEYDYISYALQLELIKAKMSSDGYTLSSDDYFTISEGQEKYRERTIYPNNEYVAIAFPTEDGLLDADVYMKELDGRLIAKDSDTDPVSVVQWEPDHSRTVRFWIKNYNSVRSGYSYDCHFLIFYK